MTTYCFIAIIIILREQICIQGLEVLIKKMLIKFITQRKMLLPLLVITICNGLVVKKKKVIHFLYLQLFL